MSGSLHAQVARDLIDRIEDGHYPVGSHLPTELELAESYGASRNTVRSALQELQELGLISRKRRAGTRVEATTPAIAYRQSLASLEGLMQFGVEHSRTVIGTEPIVTGRALARELGCSPGTRWFRITTLRHAAGEADPIGTTVCYLDPLHADLSDEIGASPSVLISALVESRYGRRIAEVRQDVDATLVSGEMASLLGSTQGSPALRLVRRYLDPAGTVFLITVTIHPAGRFTVTTRLRREPKAS